MRKKKTAEAAKANNRASKQPAQPDARRLISSRRPVTLGELGVMAMNPRARERGEILDRIARFEITPEDGEAEVARRGLTPLNPLPDPSTFDPMRELDWTLAMAAAWIAWRAPVMTRHFWDAWRDKMFSWKIVTVPNKDGGEPRQEMHLLPFNPPHATCSEVCIYASLCASSQFAPRLTGEQAMAELWTALRAGKLKLTGIDPDKGRCIIDARLKLQDLEISGQKDGDVLRGKHRHHRATYHYPTIARSDVVKIWKPDRRAGTAKAITDCKKWLVSEMKKSPHIRSATHGDLQKRAQEHFPALTGRGFKNAVHQAVKATGAKAWIAPGRPPKSRQ